MKIEEYIKNIAIRYKDSLVPSRQNELVNFVNELQDNELRLDECSVREKIDSFLKSKVIDSGFVPPDTNIQTLYIEILFSYFDREYKKKQAKTIADAYAYLCVLQYKNCIFPTNMELPDIDFFDIAEVIKGEADTVENAESEKADRTISIKKEKYVKDFASIVKYKNVQKLLDYYHEVIDNAEEAAIIGVFLYLGKKNGHIGRVPKDTFEKEFKGCKFKWDSIRTYYRENPTEAMKKKIRQINYNL